MALLRFLMASSVVVSTTILASPNTAFAARRYDHHCQAYKTHSSVGICVQWTRRKLGSIKPGKCYEWQISKPISGKKKKSCIAQNYGSNPIYIYPYAGTGGRPAKKSEWFTRDISRECKELAEYYLGQNQSYWATLNAYTGGAIPERYRAILKYKAEEYCKSYYQ